MGRIHGLHHMRILAYLDFRKGNEKTMTRLQPLKNEYELLETTLTTRMSFNLERKLEEERIRIGAKSKSEVIRLILESYFKQEIEG